MKNEIKKYLNDELTEAQALEVLKAIHNDQENLDYYISLKTEQTISELRNKTIKSDVLKAYRKLQEKLNLRRKRRNRFLFSAASAVAMLLILLGIYVMDNNQNKLVNEIVTTPNEPYKNIILSDGSTVILRKDSKFSYNDFSNASVRRVEIEGEAFFDVAKDPEKPFVVHINDLEIKVIGTQFNVKAIPDSLVIETILFSGQVNLIQDQQVISALAPSQKAVYNIKDKNVMVTALDDAGRLLEEKQGLLVFENSRLDRVLSALEERYKKGFIIQVDDIEQYHFTGKFNTSQTISEVVSILNATTPIKYRIENDTIVLENK